MRHSRSGLFLMEMILCILFFALASTVCVQLFTGANDLSNDTVNENHAIILAQNMAECFYSCEGDLHQISNDFYPLADYSTSANDLYEQKLMLYLDSEWQPTSDSSKATYLCTLDASTADEKGNINCKLAIRSSNYGNGEEDIYNLELFYHKKMELEL